MTTVEVSIPRTLFFIDSLSNLSLIPCLVVFVLTSHTCLVFEEFFACVLVLRQESKSTKSMLFFKSDFMKGKKNFRTNCSANVSIFVYNIKILFCFQEMKRISVWRWIPITRTLYINFLSLEILMSVH